MAEHLTLRDWLTNSRTGVSEAEFKASQGLDPRQGSSWAIWGESTGDLSVFDNADQVAPRLRKDVVLIGANFGLGGDAGEWKAFQNFHARTSGGDTKLRNGLTNTVLEGAFLTDLVKDYPTKYAGGLASEVKSGLLDVEKHVADGFLAEQQALGLGLETLYIPIGNRTRELWDVLVSNGVIPKEQAVFHRTYKCNLGAEKKPVLNLTHYSAAVNFGRAVDSLLSQRVSM